MKKKVSKSAIVLLATCCLYGLACRYIDGRINEIMLDIHRLDAKDAELQLQVSNNTELIGDVSTKVAEFIEEQAKRDAAQDGRLNKIEVRLTDNEKRLVSLQAELQKLDKELAKLAKKQDKVYVGADAKHNPVFAKSADDPVVKTVVTPYAGNNKMSLETLTGVKPVTLETMRNAALEAAKEQNRMLGIPTLPEREYHELAMVIAAEGEPNLDAMRLVMHVINNRAKGNYRQWHSVAFECGRVEQFSCICDGGIYRAARDQKRMSLARQVIDEFLAGEQPADPTGGATFYWRDDINAQQQRQAWVRSLRQSELAPRWDNATCHVFFTDPNNQQNQYGRSGKQSPWCKRCLAKLRRNKRNAGSWT